MKVKAYCNKEKILELLDGRKWLWLRYQLLELGINIEANTLSNLVNGRGEWKLTYAMAIAKVLRTNVENIFYLK